MDVQQFRSVMGQFATGVTVITYVYDKKPAGMTANAFMSVSLDPPLVLISVRKEGRFTAFVRENDNFGVTFLSEAQENASSHFGGRPIPEYDTNFIYHEGTPLIAEGLAQLVAKTVAIYPAGDHLLYLGEIEYLGEVKQEKPLVFFGGKYKKIHAHPVLT